MDVTSTDGHDFWFFSQGSTDGKWESRHIWNQKLIDMREAPAFGIYQFTVTQELYEKQVHANVLNIGFRCDFWSSGAFRVSNVVIRKGSGNDRSTMTI